MTQDQVETLVRRWSTNMMAAMAKAAKADQQVKDRISYVKELYAAKSEAQMRYKLEVDYDLSDALSDYRQQCSEVQRYAAGVQTLIAAHEFLTQPHNL